MEMANFIIDIILIACGVLATRYAWTVGGNIGHGSLRMMAGGFLVLGVAHFLETLIFLIIPELPVESGETIHRVIVLVGFALILTGYGRLAKFAKA